MVAAQPLSHVDSLSPAPGAPPVSSAVEPPFAEPLLASSSPELQAGDSMRQAIAMKAQALKFIRDDDTPNRRQHDASAASCAARSIALQSWPAKPPPALEPAERREHARVTSSRRAMNVEAAQPTALAMNGPGRELRVLESGNLSKWYVGCFASDYAENDGRRFDLRPGVRRGELR